MPSLANYPTPTRSSQATPSSGSGASWDLYEALAYLSSHAASWVTGRTLLTAAPVWPDSGSSLTW